MKPLDPYSLDLEQTTLIEASAGTGKTYTITTLLTRLVAQGYPVESILVVTFTEAAAAELKLRIRKRLSQALSGLKQAGPADGDDLIAFLAQLPDPDLVCRRLSHALTCFDQACIMTIHSFCLATLKAHAFETRTPFDLELTPDRSAFFQQVCMDFFMTRINDLDPLMLKFLAQKGVSPEQAAGEFRGAVSRPGLVVLPGTAAFTDIFREYRETAAKIQGLLETGSDAIADLIRDHKGLDKRSYSKKNVPAWLRAARETCAAHGDTPVFDMREKGDSLYKFTHTRLAEKTKKGSSPPDHPLFDACETLLEFQEILETNIISLKLEFLEFYDGELTRLKQEQGQCFFDDLVNDLAAALTGPGSQALNTAVRETYRACLIDEFQDTDPAQYTIFSTLFSAPGTPFFMIGDPKQAIYAFRGGDIFAYLTACGDANQRFTLEKNYRSAPKLVQGVNDLFGLTPNPFLFDAIEFSPVGTPDTARDRLGDATGPLPPLVFDLLPREGLQTDRQGRIKKDIAKRLIPRLLAREMARDLAGGQGLAGEDGTIHPLTPGDMAVLVRTNQQARAVQQALSGVNIPSYLSKTGSVFDSREALELHDILWAVFRPDHMGFIKAALTTSLFGRTLAQLARLDDGTAGEWQAWFGSLKDTWETRGFVAMAMDLFHSDRSLLHPESAMGERSLTNFYHLTELVSQAALNRHLSMTYLLKWYEAQLFPDTRDQAADELRLESDRRAVAIVTIHKSKGLEYPVVYLPYLWAGSGPAGKGPVLFHDPANQDRLTLDLRPADTPGVGDSLARQELEARAEERRLLYVALTRASACCRIFWGGISGVESTALGALLHPGGCTTDDAMAADLDRLKQAGPDRIQIRELDPDGTALPYQPAQPPIPELAARPVTRKVVRPGFRITSFTAMTAAHDDSPQSGPEPVAPETQTGLLNTQPRLDLFPKGADTGNFFHAVFENLDFTLPAVDMEPCVSEQLTRYGFTDPVHFEAAMDVVSQILDTPLAAPEGQGAGFCLRDIPNTDRLNEMEFLFDTGRVNMPALADLFEAHSSQKAYAPYLRILESIDQNGFVKGFIDMVIRHQGKFYVLDYKSNFLGDTYGHYTPAAMTRAMADHHYILQYHLYLIALHRYLKRRIPDYDHDRDFGGVFYLFIRGMHPDLPGAGIFHDRPGKSFTQELDAML